jgi:hypothetical protein
LHNNFYTKIEETVINMTKIPVHCQRRNAQKIN